MAYQLSAKPKPMMALPEGANLCGISINFCTVCALVSIIYMTNPIISKPLGWRAPKTATSATPVSDVTWPRSQQAVIVVVPSFNSLVIDSRNAFQIFLPVSSNAGGRNLFLPWSNCDFTLRIELVNKNTTEKYLYSAHFYCCFTYSSIFFFFSYFL